MLKETTIVIGASLTLTGTADAQDRPAAFSEQPIVLDEFGSFPAFHPIDADGDGIDDLLVFERPSQESPFSRPIFARGLGGGLFEPRPIELGRDIVWESFDTTLRTVHANDDPHPDVAVVAAGQNFVLLGDGAGGFSLITAYSFSGPMIFGDFNGDGLNDQVISSGVTRLYLGPDGRVADDPLFFTAAELIATDSDQDRTAEFAGVLEFGGLFIGRSDGFGNLSYPLAFSEDWEAGSLSSIDINRDGHDDLVWFRTSFDQRSGEVAYARGLGDGSYSLPGITLGEVAPGVSGQWADFDRDGWLDVFADGGCCYVQAIHFGSATGLVGRQPVSVSPYSPSVPTVWDYDSDGRPDLAANTVSGIEVTLNTLPLPCIADTTSTGAIAPGIANYGVSDGTVDLDDLGFYLNLWLAAHPRADVTSGNATLEGQRGFLQPDGLTNLGDLGLFLSSWLDGCD